MYKETPKSTDGVDVQRNTKVSGHVVLNLRQPICVCDYNAKMGGVDVFNQHIAAYRSLRKMNKYWKTIVIDFLDAVSVNCNILFKMYRAANPELIQPPRGYVAADFRSALICQLAGIAEDDPTVPLFKPAGRRSVNQLPPGKTCGSSHGC